MSIYYTYDKRYHKFYNYGQLINWIAQHSIPYVGTEWENGFLRYCGNNSHDNGRKNLLHVLLNNIEFSLIIIIFGTKVELFGFSR